MYANSQRGALDAQQFSGFSWSSASEALLAESVEVELQNADLQCQSHLCVFFFLLAGCDGSRGFWQSLTKRETVKATPEVLRLREKSSAHSTMTFGLHSLCMKKKDDGKAVKQPKQTPRPKNNTPPEDKPQPIEPSPATK